ncbi:class I adenylate-forming enzyme family protein [Salirhabdus euzebyi]|nr:long-chain fatty acid--CoA ligase [Salirhabdus euzebyi]
MRELDWINSRARLFPHDEAIVDAELNDSWSFQQLNERAILIATFFREKGVKKGDRVALLSPNHISYFDFLFACIKIGAIFVPLNWRLSKDEMDYVLSDANPKIIGIHQYFNKKFSWIEEDYYVLNIEDNHYVNDLINISQAFIPEESLNESDPLAMIYTGGTTGKPKGAVLSHRSILWNALNTIVSWNLTDEEATITTLPMFHTGGLNALIVPVLLAGGKVIVTDDFEPKKAVEDLIKHKCTIVLFVPTMYHMIIKTDAFRTSNFPHMKVFLSGGAPCPLNIYDAFEQKGLLFKEGYGLTEAGPNNFYIDPEEAKHKRGSVGKPMVFNDIKIINDNGQEVDINEVGELCLRGNHSFEFYWNKEEETKKTKIDGWLHTGDLARKDKDGFVYIVGRKKEMIISGGENIYPLEIEHWLSSLEGINEVAVVGIPHDKWGEAVAAFVSFNKGKQFNEQELQEYCSRKLSSYKIPKKFFVIDELPKTHVGKIDKKSLVQQYSNTFA